jgi:hypothetical protein
MVVKRAESVQRLLSTRLVSRRLFSCPCTRRQLTLVVHSSLVHWIEEDRYGCTVSPSEKLQLIARPCLISCFRILLATDNHIGYNEKDPIRGQDSINTFREILELAREHEVRSSERDMTRLCLTRVVYSP